MSARVPVLAAGAAIAATGSASALLPTVLLSDTFDNAASAANYSTTDYSPNGVDFYTEFGFDYSGGGGSRLTAPIPASPGGGSLNGLIVTVNDTGLAFDSGVNFYPNVAARAAGGATYHLDFDVWAGVNGNAGGSLFGGGGGTTEFINAGANASGNEVNLDAALGVIGRDSDWFENTTDGDITNDFITFTARGGTQIAEDFLRNTLGTPELPTALPSPPGLVEGAPGEQWVHVTVVAAPGKTAFYYNGVFIADLIGTDYNHSTLGTGGLPWFGYSDIFSSVAGNETINVSTGLNFDPTNASFALIDNVVVSTPEPASLALLGLGGLAAFRRRR